MMLFFCNSKLSVLAVLIVVATKLQGYNVNAEEAKVNADLNDPNLPWSSLSDQLSTDAILVATTNQDYFDQCYLTTFTSDIPQLNRSQDFLRSQPAGVCMNQLACGFEQCMPVGSSINDLPGDVEQWMDVNNPLYNIPSTVLFPVVANDVVAAVAFAIDNNLELSVKTTGHNYVGASTKKGTLMVNTHRFTKYSSTGIVECSSTSTADERSSNTVINEDLSNQACLLALARDKKAFIRVGGGEVFNDVYRSVRAFNEGQDSFKYHIIGGSEPGVSPMGWTMQGGQAPTTGGRLFGFGVDQVLQIEAVLPNGQFVRFGPTSWEYEEGYLFPRTTSVSGVCNENPEKAEAEWEWGPCPTEINFDDLWFAFRGGGGGSYGIVTSMHLQLHDYLPLEYVNSIPCLSVSPTVFTEFLFDYYFDPSNLLNVSEADSNACGHTQPCCYGEGTGKKFVSTWKTHIQSMTQELLDMDMTETSINDSLNCCDVTLYKDILELLGDSTQTLPPGIFPSGEWSNIVDDWNPAFSTSAQNILAPLSFFRTNKERFSELFITYYISYSPIALIATDQTTSLSKAHREACMHTYAIDLDASTFLAEAYNINSKDTTIPGYVDGNHFSPFNYGPLKSDPTKLCNLTEMTFEEADEKCFPVQAAVWGSENLERLEAIKKEIDPHGIFNCNNCVGNNHKDKGTEDNSGGSERYRFTMLLSLLVFALLSSIL